MLLLLRHFHANMIPELWMIACTARDSQFIPVHNINIPEVRCSLLDYRVKTDCDSTSQFFYILRKQHIKYSEIMQACYLDLEFQSACQKNC